MILLKPEVYNHLLKSVEDEKNMSDLDREIKKILSNSKLSQSARWYLYRQQVLDHANKWRNGQNKQHIEMNELKTHKPIVHENSTQTYRKPMKEMETQTNKIIDKDDYLTHLNIMNNAAMDEEISNFDVTQLTSPTNRLGISTQNSPNSVGISTQTNAEESIPISSAVRTASLLKHRMQTKAPVALKLKKKIQPESHIRKRALTFGENSEEDTHMIVKPRTRSQLLKRSDTLPDQYAIDFPHRKKTKTIESRIQSGASIKNLKWTRL